VAPSVRRWSKPPGSVPELRVASGAGHLFHSSVPQMWQGGWLAGPSPLAGLSARSCQCIAGAKRSARRFTSRRGKLPLRGRTYAAASAGVCRTPVKHRFGNEAQRPLGTKPRLRRSCRCGAGFSVFAVTTLRVAPIRPLGSGCGLSGLTALHGDHRAPAVPCAEIRGQDRRRDEAAEASSDNQRKQTAHTCQTDAQHQGSENAVA
jgi:hypothetical protein